MVVVVVLTCVCVCVVGVGLQVETVAPLEGGGAVGVVFCGRQTPGGHNVVAGLLDFLGGSGARLLGFVGGVHGLFKKQVGEWGGSQEDGGGWWWVADPPSLPVC